MLEMVRKKAADSLRMLTAIEVGNQVPGLRTAREMAAGLADLLAPAQDEPEVPASAPPPPAPARSATAEPELELWVDDLRSRIASGHDYLIVDVRDPQEWHEGIIPDSLLIPLPGLMQRIGELRDQSRPIVVVCADGSQSRGAAINLRDRGCAPVHYLRGGVWGWHRSGGGIRPGPRHSQRTTSAVEGLDG